MGVSKVVKSVGNGVDRPKSGDEITLEYTGWLYDSSRASNDCKGKMFDTSRERGPFTIEIGVGKLIQGWDEGIVQTDGGMTLGESATLTITPDYGYGQHGFPGLIPPSSTLIFDVELVAIGNKRNLQPTQEYQTPPVGNGTAAEDRSMT